MPRQTNTKEKIISSAFLMYRKMMFKEFTLNDVAKASGISKTAIFRHFTNKAELIATMTDRLFESFETVVEKIQRDCQTPTLDSTRKAIDYVFEFNKDFPGYIEYYVKSLMGGKETSERMVKLITENHLYLPVESIFKDEKKFLPENLIPFYMEISILNFLVECGRIVESGAAQNEEEFRKKITDIIFEGLGKNKNPLSLERRKELDVLCKTKLEKDENQNRFLEAFLKAIHKNGSFNITVEDIANELGMAKSSMYSFFENKMDYMKNMFRQETEFFGEILQEKCTLAKGFDEMIYVMLRSSVNYFSERPQVVFMHIFFTYHDIQIFDAYSSGDDGKEKNEFLSKSLPPYFDFGGANGKLLFIRWLSVLAVAFTFMGKKNGFALGWQDFFVSQVFEFVECGIKCCIKK